MFQIYGTPTRSIDGGIINVNVTGPDEYGLQHFEADFCALFECPLHAGKRFKTKFKIETDECIPPGNYTVIKTCLFINLILQIRSTVTDLRTDEELTCVETTIILQEDPDDEDSPFVPKPI